MHWSIEQAKNGQKTIKLNDIYLYSKYNPQMEVDCFMENEIDKTNNHFILVGLGLGYHLASLIEKVENAQIQYIILDEQELNLYETYGEHNYLESPNVQPFNGDEIFNKKAQIIIPQAFLRAIGQEHPLYAFIEDIKIRQVSFNRLKELLAINFKKNISLFLPIKKPILTSKKAALIASGPSLNNTVSWLKVHEKEFDIYCVGSALKILLQHKIYPKKVFITDAQDAMLQQIDTQYDGELIFLSTANATAVTNYKGPKQIIFQEGYEWAEQFATLNHQPLFKTGGSVATTTFSYIEWAGYEELYLFGQDLGFSGDNTHATGSTSGRKIQTYNQVYEILANDQSSIQTTKNLLAYKRWFDQAFQNSSMKIFNTAKKGAYITGSTFIDISLKS